MEYSQFKRVRQTPGKNTCLGGFKLLLCLSEFKTFVRYTYLQTLDFSDNLIKAELIIWDMTLTSQVYIVVLLLATCTWSIPARMLRLWRALPLWWAAEFGKPAKTTENHKMCFTQRTKGSVSDGFCQILCPSWKLPNGLIPLKHAWKSDCIRWSAGKAELGEKFDCKPQGLGVWGGLLVCTSLSNSFSLKRIKVSNFCSSAINFCSSFFGVHA